MKIILKNKWLSLQLTGWLLVCATACNRSVPNLLENGATPQSDTTGLTAASSRVLYLVIDGLRGEAVDYIKPTRLTQIADNAIYTYNSFNNGSDINAINWADMLTGVDSASHKVRSSDFANNQLAKYPDIFTRLQLLRPKWRTVAFSRSQALNDFLLQHATQKQVLSSDVDVTNSILNELKNKDASLVFGQLSSVDSVGSSSGYGNNIPAYATAIRKVDQYLGTILDELEARKNFRNENWLVVIASSKGGRLPYDPGAGVDTAYFNNPVSNGTVYFYNPKFVSAFVAKPGTPSYPYEGTSPVYKNDFGAFLSATNSAFYNVGVKQSATISFKFQCLTDVKSITGYPTFLNKIKDMGGAPGPGWGFQMNNLGRFYIWVGGTTSPGPARTGDFITPTIVKNTWYDITLKFFYENDTRYFTVYIDGKPDAKLSRKGINSSSYADLSNNSLLSTGSATGTPNTLYKITDIRFFDTALPDDVIAQYSCKVMIYNTHPYFDHLIGYWPSINGSGNVLTDMSPNHRDMTFNKPPETVWTPFSESHKNLCPPFTPSYVVPQSYLRSNPSGLDVPYQIYTWMGIPVPMSWGLLGKYWITSFNTTK